MSTFWENTIVGWCKLLYTTFALYRERGDFLVKIGCFGDSPSCCSPLAILVTKVMLAMVIVVFFFVFFPDFWNPQNLEFQRTNILYEQHPPPSSDVIIRREWSGVEAAHKSPILMLFWRRCFNESKRTSGDVVSTHIQNLGITLIVLSSKIAVNRNVKNGNKSTIIILFAFRTVPAVVI